MKELCYHQLILPNVLAINLARNSEKSMRLVKFLLYRVMVQCSSTTSWLHVVVSKIEFDIYLSILM